MREKGPRVDKYKIVLVTNVTASQRVSARVFNQRTIMAVNIFTYKYTVTNLIKPLRS